MLINAVRHNILKLIIKLAGAGALAQAL